MNTRNYSKKTVQNNPRLSLYQNFQNSLPYQIQSRSKAQIQGKTEVINDYDTHLEPASRWRGSNRMAQGHSGERTESGQPSLIGTKSIAGEALNGTRSESLDLQKCLVQTQWDEEGSQILFEQPSRIQSHAPLRLDKVDDVLLPLPASDGGGTAEVFPQGRHDLPSATSQQLRDEETSLKKALKPGLVLNKQVSLGKDFSPIKSLLSPGTDGKGSRAHSPVANLMTNSPRIAGFHGEADTPCLPGVSKMTKKTSFLSGADNSSQPEPLPKPKKKPTKSSFANHQTYGQYLEPTMPKSKPNIKDLFFNGTDAGRGSSQSDDDDDSGYDELESKNSHKTPNTSHDSDLNHLGLNYMSNEDQSQNDLPSSKSSSSESASSASSSSSSTSSEEKQSSSGRASEEAIQKQIESFYDKKFHKFEVCKISDYIGQRVWNVEYDSNADLVYLFLAQLTIRRDPQMEHEGEILESVTPGQAEQYEKEIEAVRVFANQKVKLKLLIQIWNADDRVLKVKSHHKKPVFERVVLRVIEKLSAPLNRFEVMQFMKNKYRDYAQTIQFDSYVYFFQDKSHIIGYNTATKELYGHPCRVFGDTNIKDFSTALHFKDFGMPTQAIESLLMLNFNQQQVSSKGGGKKNARLSMLRQNSAIFGEEQDLSNLEFKQTLELRIHKFSSQITDSYNFSQASPFDRAHKQTLKFDSDELIMYYEHNLKDRELADILFQRIADSDSYIVLFPTGLFLQVGINPFTVQAKQKLGLRRDEHIIDHTYSVSRDGKKHCVWILDQKLQVWHYSSECNANQSSWSLQRVTIFNKLIYKKFFKEATDYEDFQVMSYLQSINCFKRLAFGTHPSFEYLFAFNETCTKGVFISQPRVLHNDDENEDEHKIMTVLEHLQKEMEMPLSQILKNKIKVHMVAKEQPTLISCLQERQFTFTNPVLVKTQSVLQSLQKSKKRLSIAINDPLTLKKLVDLDNEIIELQYMGQVILKVSGNSKKQKECHQFLVRRLRSLQIMYTNALGFWTKPIEMSEVRKPSRIFSAQLSRDNMQLVCVSHTESKQLLKEFIYNESTQTFDLKEAHSATTHSEQVSYTITPTGKLLTLKLGMIGDRKGTYEPGQIQYFRNDTNMGINLPRCIFIKDLLVRGRLDPAFFSQDLRLIISGRILIPIAKDLNSVKDVGCLVQVRENSSTYYQFMSLLDSDQRAALQKIAQQKLPSILNFTNLNRPMSCLGNENTLYFTFSLLNFQNSVDGTSVVRMDTRTLACEEIYQSKYQMTHFSLNDQRKNIMARYQILQTKSHQVMPQQREFQFSMAEGTKRTRTKPKLFNSTSQGLDDESSNSEEEQSSEQEEAPQPKINQLLKHFPKKILPGKEFGSEMNAKPTALSSQNFLLGKQETKIAAGYRQNSNDKNSGRGGLNAAVEDRFDMQFNLMSLVSQVKNIINIEIIIDRKTKQKKQLDVTMIEKPKSFFAKVFNRNKRPEENQEEQSNEDHLKSLVYHIRIQQRRDLMVQPEMVWINKNKIIITVDNDYYLLNLVNPKLKNASNILFYGTQQVNSGLFASLVAQRKLLKYVSPNFKKIISNEFSSNPAQIWVQLGQRGSTILNQFEQSDLLTNDVLEEASEAIQRMEIASLVRYCLIRRPKHQKLDNRTLAFFTPCEELDGGSVFSRLSGDFNVIQPYLDAIDTDFIEQLNFSIRNINYYLNQRAFKFEVLINYNKGSFVETEQFEMSDQGETPESKRAASKSLVHMYQDDIVGNNAIDNAFEKNSIFSIKAFVDNLLQLTEQMTFRNCFDQALIIMIKKNLDVKQLVDSELFYPPLWEDKTIFSEDDKPMIKAYYKDLEDLEVDNPSNIFEDQHTLGQENGYWWNRIFRKSTSGRLSTSLTISQQFSLEKQLSAQNESAKQSQQAEEAEEEKHEVQFNYIYLDKIQGENKTDLMRYLSQSDDLELFQQEAIRMIVDYKWDTYTRQFFIDKLVYYFGFLVVFFVDIDYVFIEDEEADERTKGGWYIARKSIGILIQMFFFIYEMRQLYKSGKEYFLDIWNYFELGGICLYFAAVVEDWVKDDITDTCKALYVGTILLSLVKVLFLLRVFKYISFLVSMVIQVVIDLLNFLIVFGIFVFTFAQCYLIVELDTSTYGRFPRQMALIMSTLRSAFGDFALIDAKRGFDILNDDGSPRFSTTMVNLTFGVYILQVFTLFMILMNFIIAVISDSYAQVTAYSEGHNYKQRVSLIHEREVQFQPSELMNEEYFPNILIVRQKKKNDSLEDNTDFQSQIKSVKLHMKDLNTKVMESIEIAMKEAKDNLNSQVKLLENENLNMGKDIQKVFSEVQNISRHFGSRRGSFRREHSEFLRRSDGGVSDTTDRSTNFMKVGARSLYRNNPAASSEVPDTDAQDTVRTSMPPQVFMKQRQGTFKSEQPHHKKRTHPSRKDFATPLVQGSSIVKTEESNSLVPKMRGSSDTVAEQEELHHPLNPLFQQQSSWIQKAKPQITPLPAVDPQANKEMKEALDQLKQENAEIKGNLSEVLKVLADVQVQLKHSQEQASIAAEHAITRTLQQQAELSQAADYYPQQMHTHGSPVIQQNQQLQQFPSSLPQINSLLSRSGSRNGVRRDASQASLLPTRKEFPKTPLAVSRQSLPQWQHY